MDIKFILGLLLFSNSFISVGQAGTLDPAFDGDGIRVIPIGLENDLARAVTVQPDGMILCAGNAVINDSMQFAVARGTPDGSADTGFSDDGLASATFGQEAAAFCMALQPDGRIVLAGNAYIGSSHSIALARFLPDGSLDPSFGNGGKVLTTVAGVNCEIYDIVLQNDGRIVIAGNGFGADPGFLVARYNADGTPDATFNGTGMVITPMGVNATAYGLVIQGDGKLLAAGYSDTGTEEELAMARYHSDGSLDGTFDGDGILTVSLGFAYERINGIATDPDGNIVCAGFVGGTFGILDMLAARFTPNGALDNSFGTGGVVQVDFEGGGDGAYAVALQSDGKILLAGSADLGAQSAVGLVRLTAVGALDGSFSGGGKVVTEVGSQEDAANDIAIQADGKIVLAGSTRFLSTRDMVVLRYINDLPEGILGPDAETLPLALYPCPAKDRINVILPSQGGATRLRIRDTHGRLVLEERTVAYELRAIDITTLTAGVYSVEVTTGAHRYAARFVK